MWDHLNARHIYLDANIFIEAFEGFSPASTDLKALFALVEAGTTLATTSEWTLAEILVRPFATSDTRRAQDYLSLLSPAGFIKMEPVSHPILMAAAHICAERKMPLPDCIHVATAVRAGCDAFLTRDRGIELPSHMERVFPGEG